jgi:glycosyltransferase involved in cell wall biosynthesis
MRILHVIESLGHGGAEQVLLNMLPEVQARGHVCEVATLWPIHKPGQRPNPRSTRSLQGDLERRGVRVHRLPWTYTRRWSLISGAARVASLARRTKCDIVHAHLLFSDLYVGLSRPLLPGVALVASLQNTDFDFFVHSLPGRVAGKILPHVLRHGFDGLMAVGAPVREHFEQHVPGLSRATLLETIVNAVPVPELPATVDRETILRGADADPARFVLLIAARLAPEKNHRALFEALELLRARGMHPQVLVGGVGPLEGELREMVRARNLESQVIFCGHIAHETLHKLMLACDTFVLPSLHEGLPLAIAEAMSLARPVLATPVGGVPDLIEDDHTGLLAPPSDASALARKIEMLMHDADLRARLGTAARVRIEQKFSARAVAAQWEDFYVRSLERRRA